MVSTVSKSVSIKDSFGMFSAFLTVVLRLKRVNFKSAVKICDLSCYLFFSGLRLGLSIADIKKTENTRLT